MSTQLEGKALQPTDPLPIPDEYITFHIKHGIYLPARVLRWDTAADGEVRLVVETSSRRTYIVRRESVRLHVNPDER